MKNIQLNNTEHLEDGFSNIDAATQQQIAQGATQLAAIIAANKAAKDAAFAQTGCKKPFLNIGTAKTNYNRCLAVAQQTATAKEAAANDLARAQIASNERMMAMQTQSGANAGAAKTFLGMPQTVGIIVTIVGSLALVVGGIVLVKKLSHK